jgi:hypothetical protein
MKNSIIKLKINHLFAVIDSSGFWFSASTAGQTPGQQFRWTDNTTWLNGQQSDSDGTAKEKCVLYNTESANLYSSTCLNTWRILCEVPDTQDSCLTIN